MKININFSDFWDGFDKNDNDFINILRNYFDVEISERPDWIFYSCFGNNYLKYDCIRIFYAGECQTPDFNACDYAIGFDRIDFGDRYIRLPIYMIGNYRKPFLSLMDRDEFTVDDLKSKSEFCSFVYSNCFAGDFRTDFFYALNKYKHVNSGGRYLNNIGRPIKDKLEFQRRHKFAIAFENTAYPGYVTEKIMQAFEARTIPIYFGASDIGQDFLEGSFVNCHNFNNFDDAVDFVKKIDNDDALYLKMINSQCVADSDLEDRLEKFLIKIFSQNQTLAIRRPNNPFAKCNQDIIKRHAWYEKNIKVIDKKIKLAVGKYKNHIIK